MSRNEVFNQYYLRITDIMILMQVGRTQAKRMFDKAKKMEVDTDPIYAYRVEMPNFIKANRINIKLLQEQINRCNIQIVDEKR